MNEQTDLQIEKAAMIKAYRAAVRLKHSIAADREVKETLPNIVRQIDDALQSGKPLSLNPGEAFSAHFGD